MWRGRGPSQAGVRCDISPVFPFSIQGEKGLPSREYISFLTRDSSPFPRFRAFDNLNWQIGCALLVHKAAVYFISLFLLLEFEHKNILSLALEDNQRPAGQYSQHR